MLANFAKTKQQITHNVKNDKCLIILRRPFVIILKFHNQKRFVCTVFNITLVLVLVTQSCPTLCDPMDCSPPGSSVHEIFQATILEWVSISSSRGSSQPRDWTWVSCTAGRFCTDWATREAPTGLYGSKISCPLDNTTHKFLTWTVQWWKWDFIRTKIVMLYRKK